MDSVMIAAGGLARAGLGVSAVWAGLFPLLFFGAADWPGFLATHLSIAAVGAALLAVSFIVLCVALVGRIIRRPAPPPPSA